MKIPESIKVDDQLNLKALVDLGIYDSEDEAIHNALKSLLESNNKLRLKLAIHRYQNGEISLGKAAEIAELCWEDMKDILIKEGISPKLGPQNIDEAREDYLTLERFFNEQKCNC